MVTLKTPPSLAATIALPALLLSLLVAAPASAAVPSNDDAAAAAVVMDVPYTNTQDTAEATSNAEDTCGLSTVWYMFTPTVTGTYQVDTFGSNFDTTLAVHDGSPSGDPLECVDDTIAGLQAGLVVDMTAGTTYYFEAGTCCGVGEPGQANGGGDLVFNVSPSAEALTVDVSVDDSLRSGPLPGQATVTGTVVCSEPTDSYVFIEWRQRQGRNIVSGYSDTFVACTTTPTTWSLTLDSAPRTLTGSRVYVIATAQACGGLTCDSDTESRELKPRGR